MQVELSKLEDVKFSSFRPSAFWKYFAFYGLIRTDTVMLLIDFLNLPIRCIYSDFQKILSSHFGPWPILVPDCTATVYDVFFFFSFLVSGVLSNRNPPSNQEFHGVSTKWLRNPGFLAKTGFLNRIICFIKVSSRMWVSSRFHVGFIMPPWSLRTLSKEPTSQGEGVQSF